MNVGPRLIAFTDSTRGSRASLLERYSALAERAEPGSVLFVVRDYALGARERWLLARDLHALTRRTAQLLGFADRADIARALGADALHLPESGLLEDDARRAVTPGTFISRACHDPNAALDTTADAVLLSPIVEARKGRAALGVQTLARVCAARTPSSPLVYALGGVSAESARACLDVGAAGIAVIGAALDQNPLPLLEALQISR